MYKKIIPLLATTGLITVAQAQNDASWSAGLYAGSTGVGVSAGYQIKPWLTLKGELGGLAYSHETDIDDVDYDGDFEVFAAGLTADINPFYNTPVVRGLRISLGAYAVDNKFDITASSPGQEIEIGNAATYTLQAGDTVDGSVEFSSLAPYAGIGWDFMFGEEDRFTVSLDLGVLFTGSPDVDLTPNSVLLGRNVIDLAEFDNEVESIKDDTDDFKYYPVAKLGFQWRF